MKKLIIILLCLPLGLFSQEEDKPSLYEVVNIKVKDGQEKAFETAVKKHNAEFHKEDGLYHARLFYNINGPDGGTYSWIMGPTNYTAMDDRPGEGAHDDDWNLVMTHAESSGNPSYWNFDVEKSQIVEGAATSKRLIWMYDIKPGQYKRWGELVAKVKEVYEVKRPDEPFWVVWNDFADSEAGRDAVVIFAFDKWSWMDRKSEFGKQYEEVNGPGSWHHFLNEFTATVDGRVDWLRTIVE